MKKNTKIKMILLYLFLISCIIYFFGFQASRIEKLEDKVFMYGLGGALVILITYVTYLFYKEKSK